MAKWYYYNENNEKIGPVRGRNLIQLAQQGTISPQTIVEDENGKIVPARQVTGLTFPEAINPETTPIPTFTDLPVAIVPPPPSTVSVPIPLQTSESTWQYDNGVGKKINKVIIVENTVRGMDTFFALLFPFQDNFYSEKLENQFSEILATHNRHGWNVVSMTYGFSPHPKLSGFQRLLLAFCTVLLAVLTIGIYLLLYAVLAYFKRGRIDQYTVILEKTIDIAC